MGALIILHGWTYSTKKWGGFVALLQEKGFNTHLLKIPGLTGPLDRPWQIADYVLWLDAIVGQQKQIVILLGHSNGGRIAGAYAAQYPQKVSRLILIDSAGIYHRHFFIRMKRAVFYFLAQLGKNLTSSLKAKQLLYRLAGESDYKQAPEVTRQTMRHLITTDFSPIFARIKTPTLIIWGKHDPITPLSDGQQIHALIKNSTLQIVQSAKHGPQFTHPEEVCQIIQNYLRT